MYLYTTPSNAVNESLTLKQHLIASITRTRAGVRCAESPIALRQRPIQIIHGIDHCRRSIASGRHSIANGGMAETPAVDNA